MTTTSSKNWNTANQDYLMARLAVIREVLARHIARQQQAEQDTADEAMTGQTLQAAAQSLPSPAALDRVCHAFELSSFERDVLLLCAGIELDSAFAELCAAAQGDPRRTYPTFSLALAALPEAHWSALTPVAPLRRWRLLEVGTGQPLTTAPLRIDERVLHYLTGLSYLDVRLNGLVEPLEPSTLLPDSHRELAHHIINVWSNTGDPSSPPVIQLCGDAQDSARAVAAYASAAVGVQLHVIRMADIPTTVADIEALARLWEREARLSHSALLLDSAGSDPPQTALTLMEGVNSLLLVSSREPLRSWRRAVIRLDVKTPNAAEQHHLWHEALGSVATQLNGHLDLVASQFNLGTHGIEAASRQLLNRASTSLNAEALSAELWEACRLQTRQRLDHLAQRIEPMASWRDLILPEVQLQSMREILAQVRQRAKVYEHWGFAAKAARGLGITALFAGSSGTGKTLAAEILAHELRLDLYSIDLSQVVSKYIGETEKNLKRVFDAAEEGGAVLLFDEADALFGKRSDVKDSHDRYANIEVSYLLQRMESYRGLAVLTTNLKHALDTAFLRRIRFIVSFPFPDATQRAKIWQRIFPANTPTEGLDVNKLARLNAVGGHIRNIALHAAFLAADEGLPIRMAHLLRGARNEYDKQDKALTEAETGGWV